MKDDKELVEIALKAMGNSYAPYSNFSVGCALLCDDGSVYTGCNVENSSYGATLCAERVAAAKAISEGKTRFIKMAVISSGNEFTMPCGICRQFMSEFVGPGFEIICANRLSEFVKYNFSGLFPYAFELKHK